MKSTTRIKHSFNQNFFSNGIVSFKHAYICGFFATDGTCAASKRYIGWDLKYIDHMVLTNIAKTIDGTQKTAFLCHQAKRTGKIRYSVRLNINSTQFATDLNDLVKCDPGRKTVSIRSLEHLENEYVSGLLLGIIDGDGSWYFNITPKRIPLRLALRSINLDFVEWVQHVINKNVINCKGSIYKNNPDTTQRKVHWLLKYTKQEEVHAIANWLYESISELDGLYLNRKYETVQLFNSLYENNTNHSYEEKLLTIKSSRFNQKMKNNNELYKLILISKGIIPVPNHFHFQPSFYCNCHQIPRLLNLLD